MHGGLSAPLLGAVLAEKPCSSALGALGLVGVYAAVYPVSAGSEPTQISWGSKSFERQASSAAVLCEDPKPLFKALFFRSWKLGSGMKLPDF